MIADYPLTLPQLPDIIPDYEKKLQMHSTKDQAMKLTSKEIAHSLRLVADQVDQKYCQVSANSIV